MENQDKLLEQFKKAAENSEAKDFPGMEKVWMRVEEKLDAKVLQNESQVWKKIAVAASFLLLFTLGYQFFKPTVTAVPTNEIVNETENNSKAPTLENQSEEIVTIENPIIKEDADKIVSKQINKQSQIGFIEENSGKVAEEYNSKDTVTTKEIFENKERATLSKRPANSNQWLGKLNFEAISVKNAPKAEEKSFSSEKTKSTTAQEKADPLVVLDGKAITSNKSQKNKSNSASFSTLDPEDVETITILKEPLYIINGTHYSEEELFGPNPTSPYAPLNKQEIESTSILEGEMAVSLYGEQGKKGVVIITTKNKKPLTKKGN